MVCLRNISINTLHKGDDDDDDDDDDNNNNNNNVLKYDSLFATNLLTYRTDFLRQKIWECLRFAVDINLFFYY